jgi:hypothetical protein
MANAVNTLRRVAFPVVLGGAGIATAGLLAGMVMTVASQPASALPAYAQQTGKACNYCHTNPAGGGALTANGEKFKANGHKL